MFDISEFEHILIHFSNQAEPSQAKPRQATLTQAKPSPTLEGLTIPEASHGAISKLGEGTTLDGSFKNML